jgi:hypothetical protein
MGLDVGIVSEVDQNIWAAVFSGYLILAVPCELCGRPLMTRESREARRGPACRAKSDEAVAPRTSAVSRTPVADDFDAGAVAR